jgi:endonuclease/exonuclease/phosphatase family metal-dependent hydrolase
VRHSLAALLLCASIFAGCGGGKSGSDGRGPDLTVVSLNILHGLFCSPETANCRLSERVDLFFEWIRATGCPDVATLQEGTARVIELVRARVESVCPFPYEVVLGSQLLGVDDEIVLTRYPATRVEQLFLHPGFRRVLLVTIDHPIGPVDVFSTHLAAGSDGARVSCEGTGIPCPPECVAGGARTVRECQAVQVAEFAAARHEGDAPAAIVGDFNDPPGSFVYEQFVSRGWIDAYLEAGNPECDPMTGVGCTSGREDEALIDLESRASNQVERIDFIFVIPPGSGSTCSGEIDSGEDDDGDGVATRLFADEPNPFAPTCGPLPDPICWPSDHTGMQLDLNCSHGEAPG